MPNNNYKKYQNLIFRQKFKKRNIFFKRKNNNFFWTFSCMVQITDQLFHISKQYSLISHNSELIPLIKFLIAPTIHVREWNIVSRALNKGYPIKFKNQSP